MPDLTQPPLRPGITGRMAILPRRSAVTISNCSAMAGWVEAKLTTLEDDF
jgi:hypothetical protein